LLLILGIPALAGETGKSHLPHREALATEIIFWKKIFSEISLNQYLIHDSQNLGIIYKLIAIDTTLGPRQRSKELEAAKDEVKNLLLKFHAGEFEETALAPWERQVYEQFAALAEKDKFLQASERVRAQQGIRENFLAGVKRSFAYLPHIETVFRQEDLPHELIYLPHVESSFNPEAMSHVGAAGMWQFMRGTARGYMKIDRVADERFDPLVSTRSAARLLKYNYRELRDWALAITAYNHGLGSMRKAKRQHGNYMTIRENYLRRSFGFASKNFYPEFLAVVDISDSIDHYFPGIEKTAPLEFQEIQLPRAVKLPWFSNAYQIPAEELRRLNPAYRKAVWSGDMPAPAGYRLRLPLQADAYKILASLGAPQEKLGDILVAQLSLDRQQLIITSFNELQARRKTLAGQLAASHSGVEGVSAPLPALAAGPGIAEEETIAVLDFPAGANRSTAENPSGRLLASGKPGVGSAGAPASFPGEPPSKRIAASPEGLASPNAAAIAGFSNRMESLNGAALPAAIDPARLKPGIAIAPATANPAAFFLAMDEALAEAGQKNLPTVTPAYSRAAGAESLAGIKPQTSVVFSKPAAQGELLAEARSFSRELAFFVPANLPEAGHTIPGIPAHLEARVEAAQSAPVFTKTGVEEQWIALPKFGQPVTVTLAETPPQTAPALPGEVRLPAGALIFSKPLVEETSPLPPPGTVSRFFRLDWEGEKLDTLWAAGGPRGTWLSSLKPGVEQGRERFTSQARPKTAAPFSPETASAESKPGYSGGGEQEELGWIFAPGSELWIAGAGVSPESPGSPEITALLKRRLNPEQEMIRVFPQETLGHFSEWLNVSISQLRRMNNLSGREKLFTGQPLKLDFSRVAPAQFLEKRLRYHLSLISLYTRDGGQIKLEDYTIRSGENLWSLAHKRYKFPVNLLLYFNDFDKLERLYPGDVIKLPILYH